MNPRRWSGLLAAAVAAAEMSFAVAEAEPAQPLDCGAYYKAAAASMKPPSIWPPPQRVSHLTSTLAAFHFPPPLRCRR